MKLTDLNFHQTFPPSRDQLSRLLTSDVFDTDLTKDEISEITGIPTGKSSGKVEPHIAYAEYMGLLEDQKNNGKHHLVLSKLGQQIISEDPGISEEVTTMVCHLRLTSPFGGASLWETIFVDILANNLKGIPQKTLLDILNRQVTSPVKIGPFTSSYTNELFAPLNLIRNDGDTISIYKHSYNHELIYVYCYALFREWELAHPGQDEITADEVEKFAMPKCVGWDRNDLYSAMENMQDKHLLTFNRQLVPYTVTKHQQADQLISLLYSELC